MNDLKFSKLERLLNHAMTISYYVQEMHREIVKDYKLDLETLAGKMTPLTDKELEEILPHLPSEKNGKEI